MSLTMSFCSIWNYIPNAMLPASAASPSLAQRRTVERDQMRPAARTIHESVGDEGITDESVPILNGALADKDDRGGTGAIGRP